MRGRSCDLRLLLLFIICSVSVRGASVSGFRICAYNLQNFTPEKASNLQMLHTLTRFLSRYDICLLQHVVDPDGTAIKALVSKLNSYDKHIYKSVSSRALGKSSDNMQQYVFLYRTRTVNITGQHQYTGQSFVRPPFVVQFQSNKTEINQFVLVPLHSDEDQVIQEIDWLYDVFEEVSRKWNNTNVMFLGDFHASCAYVTRANRKNIRLYTNNSFSWMIDEKEDTTVTDTTNCAYDRIVVHGQPFLRAIVPGSGQVNKFKFRRYKPSTEKVLAISSHYPVEVQLKSSAPLLQATPLLILAVIVCFRL
ncbi:deoxyribonuclease-1-like isoform X2 [Kryptolebias marmoratus]|uniref:deoxyribonuclease-1-like isoform X2 n=1 Tax=Kryptolebias marmoratus TaxID=37003 RepID=UPI0007F92D21|nr:deoxyribonuclease-1-like isoform X2 [Kryptolebias marmoratus]